MPGTRDLKENLVLPLELDFLVVEAPRQQHVSVNANELIGREAGAGTTGGLSVG